MWWALAGAILIEVVATLSLRASDGFRKKGWIVPVTLGYLASFYLLWFVAVVGYAGRHRLRHLDRMRLSPWSPSSPDSSSKNRSPG